MKMLPGLVLLLLSASASSGAVDNPITSSRSHSTWDDESGFPGGHVYAMTQTADGYLWFGTGNGLVRYDGLRFEFIPRENSNDLSNGLIPRVLTDASGQLWAIDDFTHLFRYEAGALTGPVPDNGRHDYAPSSVNMTSDGWLLFISELQGVVEYKQGERRVLLEPRAVPGPPTAVAQTADGTIWIGTAEKGLFKFRPEEGEASLLQVPSLRNKRINCLLPLANTTLLVGTKQGLFISHRNNSFSEVSLTPRHDEILALASGFKGRIWIGTENHVFKVDPKDIDAKGRIRPLEQLTVNGNTAVTALFEDRDGNLWIGEPEAIERYRDSAFITYRSSEDSSEGSAAGLPCSNCGAIYADSDQGVWFAPPDGGLFRISQGRVQSIEIDGLKNDIVYSIAGAEDEVWVARRNGGLTRLTVEGTSVRASPQRQPSESFPIQDAVYSVFREPNGTVWAGTLHRGLSRLRNGTWRTFTTKDGLPSDGISVITGNESGLIFVGTPDGLAELRNDRWTSYNTHDGLPPGAIESLFLDGSDTLWIGTSRGIAFLRSGVVHVPLGAPTALYGDILGIAEKNGWLWIATSDHILRVRCSALLKQEYAEGDYREFGVTDGLPTVEGVKRSPSVELDNRGNIWFSLKQGISFLAASAFADPAFPVTIRIEGTLVDGKYVATGDHIRIPSGRHRLTFQYAGINVSNPEGVRYHYRLADVDSPWSEPTPLREVDFTNIAPGRFEFQVAARNPDGVWNSHVSAIVFEVEPSILQTRWFQAASVGILALFALGAYRLRVQQLHRQFNIGLEARVNERTRIARELHDTLLQSLQGLMLHFQTGIDLLPGRPVEARKTLEIAVDRADQAINEGRDAVQGLRASAVEGNDLVSAVRILGEELGAADKSENSPVFEVEVEGAPRNLHPILRDEVYRIAAEAMRNAFRHARAQRIEVEILYGERWLRLRVRDDGKGIDPKLLSGDGRAGHYGLHGMRERAQLAGGKLVVWSKLDSGTEVDLSIPATTAYATSYRRRSWLSEKLSGKGANGKETDVKETKIKS
jgi:signal transduction histidine kinase/ligand-binding sensor domain-containing protein